MSNLDSEKLVAIATYTNPHDAEFAKVALEQARIKASVEGSLQAGYTGILKVRVFVFEKDRERALDVLDIHSGEN